MASADSSAGEKVYHFISDPDHKENLSGRVRAACLNCRRKKIKCSGELSCRICEERGLVCEGPPERKRPKRKTDLDTHQQKHLRQDHSSRSDHSPTLPSSSRQHSIDGCTGGSEGPRSSITRPTDGLVALNAGDSNDSGYFSNGPIKDRQFDPIVSVESTLSVYERGTNVPTSMDWRPMRSQPHEQPRAGHFQVDSSEPNRAQISEMASSSNPAEWPYAADEVAWWPKQQTGTETTSDYSDLMNAATLLEERAQSLRRLALQHASEDLAGVPQQAIAGEPVQPRWPNSMFPIHPQSTTDDLAAMLSMRGTASAMTGSGAEFESWWDVQSNDQVMDRTHHPPHDNQ